MEGVTEADPTVEESDPASSEDYGCGAGCDDCRIWLFGGEGADFAAKKTVLSFDGDSWSEETDIPAARAYSGIAVTSGKVWLFGGSDSNSVYTSVDGQTWESPGTIPISISPFNSIAVYKNKFWMSGGGLATAINTVFSSSNGLSWDLAGTLPINMTRHTASVLGDIFWLYGGYTNSPLSSVMRSFDGVDWTQQLSVLPMNLNEMARATWNGQVWLAGGSSDSDEVVTAVLSSSNAIQWTETGNLPEARSHGSMIAYKDKLWFIGGLDSSTHPTSKVWSSTDGATWTEETELDDAQSGAAIAIYSPTCGTGVSQ